MRVDDTGPISCEHIGVIEVRVSVVAFRIENELLNSFCGGVREEIMAEVYEIGAVVPVEERKLSRLRLHEK